METILRFRYLLALLVVFEILFFWGIRAEAHCDTLDGPVVQIAKTAIRTGDVTPVLKWVSSDDETTIRAAFNRTISVRKFGGDAESLADRYFFETLVRIHRASEGASYSGLKPGTDIDPAVALADKAIQSGSSDKLVRVLTRALGNGLRARFGDVMQTAKHADESVESGRKFVKAYVTFTHYAESIHGYLKGGDTHNETH